jgi:ABC-type phosphate transport system auxiliary subunit
MRKQLKQLTAENEHLRARVAELEKVLDGQAIQDRLMQEEQRVENLQGQLMVLAEKEADLQSHLDNVTEQLRPEYLNQLQVLGSLRPEEVRESTRRRLAKEQRHLETQLELLHQNKARLQSSISMADLQIQNLRLKMQTVLHP